MENKKVPNKLEAFIDTFGLRQFASLMGVTRQAVHKWKTGQTAPDPHVAYKIIILSHKRLSFEEIYLPYLEKKLSKQSIETKYSQLSFKF